MRERTTVDWKQNFKVSKCFSYFFTTKTVFFLKCRKRIFRIDGAEFENQFLVMCVCTTQMDGKTCCQNRRMNIIKTFNRTTLINIQQLWIPTKCRTIVSATVALPYTKRQRSREKKRLYSLDDAGR